MFSHNRGDLSYPVTVTCATEEVKQYGRFGLATWDTQADYKDVKVSRGDKVLFDGNAPGTDSAWQPGKGDWKVKDGVITQSASGTDFRAIAGETDWSDYTISLKARKNGGAEGFMVMFNVRDDKNWTWCNFGGWGNRSHGIETCINGAKGQMAQMVNGTIETGQWYDIRVEVAGKHVRSFLDGKLIHDTQYPANPHLAASAAYDKTSEEIILKVVNRSDKPKQTEVSFTGSRKLAETALCQILSGIPEAENTLENPEAVSPQAATIEGIGNTFTHAFAASSLTVMRIKTK
jgi:alpha-L-arabinofuranosidase